MKDDIDPKLSQSNMIKESNKYKKIQKLKEKMYALEFSDCHPCDNTTFDEIEKYHYFQEDWVLKNDEGCDCGLKRLVKASVKSNYNTWRYLCGDEYEYLVCPRCRKVLKFELTMTN